jgi:hypothetical protein
MNLEDYHCDSLDLSFRFSVEDFDKTTFFKETGIEDESEYIDDDGDLLIGLSFPSREEPARVHGHLTILIRKGEDIGSLTIGIHVAGPRPLEKLPPYLEEAPRWLAQFFKTEITSAQVNVSYIFEDKFESTIPLPFPLIASDRQLAGLKVNGLSLLFPEDALPDGVVLQRGDDDIYVFVATKQSLVFKDFDVTKQLDDLSGTVKSLVKEKANVNDAKTTKTKDSD